MSVQQWPGICSSMRLCSMSSGRDRRTGDPRRTPKQLYRPTHMSANTHAFARAQVPIQVGVANARAGLEERLPREHAGLGSGGAQVLHNGLLTSGDITHMSDNCKEGSA